MLLLAVGTLIATVPAYADSCGSIIAGASTAGYRGTYGGYDADGNCHARQDSTGRSAAMRWTERDCRQMTGNLFVRFVPDGGANYSRCVFRQPTSGQARGGSQAPTQQQSGGCPSGYLRCKDGCAPPGSVCCASGGSCRSGYVCAKTECLPRSSARVCPDGGYCNVGYECNSDNKCVDPNARERDAARRRVEEEAVKMARESCRDAYKSFSRLDDYDLRQNELNTMRKNCPQAGLSNLLASAQKDNDENVRMGKEECTKRLAETSWCSSSTPPRSSQVHCIDGPVQTGDADPNSGLKNFSVGLNLSCSAEYYMGRSNPIAQMECASGTW
jgi:hypothetical protein